jgi:hypothetical protein
MAEKPENIVLEHLRHIRRVVDKLEADMTVIKSRITSFETTMATLWHRSATCSRKLPARPVASTEWKNGSDGSSSALTWRMPEADV